MQMNLRESALLSFTLCSDQASFATHSRGQTLTAMVNLYWPQREEHTPEPPPLPGCSLEAKGLSSPVWMKVCFFMSDF